MSESENTVALRVVAGFHGLSQNDIIHVDPDDEYYRNLMSIGLLAYAYPEDDPAAQATILATNEQGETTTLLGVRAARPKRKYGSSHGETDPE